MPFFLWALIGVIAVIGLISLLPKPDIENARASNLGDFQFPRADEGDPIGLVYGRVKLKSPNTLWYGDFEAVAVTEKVKTGLFSSKRVTTGYKYYIGMNLGLCIGENVTLHRIWAGKDLMWPGTADGGMGPSGAANGNGYALSINQPQLFGGEKKQGGIVGSSVFYSGNNDQPVDAYLAGQTDGSDTSAYPSICHLVMYKTYIGTTTQLKPFYFEVSRYTNNLAIPDGKDRIGDDDINPVEILYDLLTNKFARRGIPVDKIDVPSWHEAAVALHAEGNGMSLKVEASSNAGDVAEEIMRQIDGLMYQDPETGRIVLKLVRNDYVEGDLPLFDRTSIEKVDNFNKTLWEETMNQVRVSYRDRAQDYTDRPVLEQDMANINYQQQVRSVEVKFPGLYDKDLAQRLARRELAGISIPLFACDVLFNRKARMLRPGDVFRFTWDPLNLDETIMRVQKYNLGTLEDGRIGVTCVQDKFASLSTSFATPTPSTWVPTTNSPSDAANVRLWRAPQWFADQLGDTDRSNAYLFGFAEQPDGRTLSYDLATTQAGATDLALDDSFFTLVGITTADMPADTATIASQGISSIDEPAGAAASTGDIKNGRNLALIGNELVAFDVGTETTLTNVYRALLETDAVAHPAGTPIYFLGDLENLVVHPYFPDVQISGLFTTSTATIGQSAADGVTALYTPPVVGSADARAQDVNVAAAVEGEIPAGDHPITWSFVGRSDKTILLPGDPVPTAPAGTAARIVIRNGASVLVDEVLAADVVTYTHTFSASAAITIEVAAVVDGVQSAYASAVYSVGASLDAPVIPAGVPEPIGRFSARDVVLNVSDQIITIVNTGSLGAAYNANYAVGTHPTVVQPVDWGGKDVINVPTSSSGGFALATTDMIAKTIIAIVRYKDGTVATFSDYEGITGSTSFELTGHGGQAHFYNYGNPLFVDGVLTPAPVTFLPASKRTGASTRATGGPVLHLFRDDFSANRNWEGLVGEIMAFDVVLTEAQILELHNNLMSYYS